MAAKLSEHLRKKIAEYISRLNGFGCPVFSVSWTPSADEVQSARHIIAFFEDRRVLFNKYDWEVPDHCIHSVIEMRHFLTDEIGKLSTDSKLLVPLRSMRAGCIKFMNECNPHANHTSWQQICSALGELRATFGHQIAILAVGYGIEVDSELERIMPFADSDVPHLNQV